MLVKVVPGPHTLSNAEYGKLNTFYFLFFQTRSYFLFLSLIPELKIKKCIGAYFIISKKFNKKQCDYAAVVIIKM